MPVEHSPTNSMKVASEDGIVTEKLFYNGRQDDEELGACGPVSCNKNKTGLDNPLNVLKVMDKMLGMEEPTTGVKPKTYPQKLYNFKAKENPLLNVTKIISIQSLLTQFSHLDVRADFINGAFGDISINVSLLEQIDELRWTLMPRWMGGEIGELERSSSAAYHFNQLINRSGSLFVTNSNRIENCMTYEEWMETLEMLSVEDYWASTPAENRCLHVLPIDKKKKIVKPLNHSGDKLNIVDSKLWSDNSKKNSSKKKVEQIVISSSSSESLSSQESESQSSDSSSKTKLKKKVRRSRRRLDKRDVVIPPKFQIGGNLSLREFLDSFEKYFLAKYQGSEYDKTQKLSEFLTDELLKVYNVRGARKLPYSEMKTHLLEYYKKQKIGGTSYWRKKLSESVPSSNESLELYGLRLMEIAQKSYTRDKKECASQLRNHFLKTIPTELSHKIQETESTLKATGTTKHKHLTFEKLTRLANELQDKNKSKSVMLAYNDHQVMPEKNYNATHQEKKYKSRNVRPRNQYRDKSPAYQPTSSVRNRGESRSEKPQLKEPCKFCGNQNHRVEECWRANKKCLICGADHEMLQCPRFNPNFKGSSNPALN